MTRVVTILSAFVAVLILIVLCTVDVVIWNWSKWVFIFLNGLILIFVALLGWAMTRVSGAADAGPKPSAPSSEALTKPNIDKYYDYDPYGDVPGDYDK